MKITFGKTVVFVPLLFAMLSVLSSVLYVRNHHRADVILRELRANSAKGEFTEKFRQRFDEEHFFFVEEFHAASMPLAVVGFLGAIILNFFAFAKTGVYSRINTWSLFISLMGAMFAMLRI